MNKKHLLAISLLLSIPSVGYSLPTMSEAYAAVTDNKVTNAVAWAYATGAARCKANCPAPVANAATYAAACASCVASYLLVAPAVYVRDGVVKYATAGRRFILPTEDERYASLHAVEKAKLEKKVKSFDAKIKEVELKQKTKNISSDQTAALGAQLTSLQDSNRTAEKAVTDFGDVTAFVAKMKADKEASDLKAAEVKAAKDLNVANEKALKAHQLEQESLESSIKPVSCFMSGSRDKARAKYEEFIIKTHNEQKEALDKRCADAKAKAIEKANDNESFYRLPLAAGNRVPNYDAFEQTFEGEKTEEKHIETVVKSLNTLGNNAFKALFDRKVNAKEVKAN